MNPITMVLIDSFDPTSISEKILTNKIYLTIEHVLTKLIKLQLILMILNLILNLIQYIIQYISGIEEIEEIKY